MSAERKYRNINDFLRYLKGVFSNRERHEFERDLETDPFAKEALERLEKLTPREAEQDLLDLHSRLRERLESDRPERDKTAFTRTAGTKRIDRRKRIAIYSAAAVVASLLIVGTVFLQLYDFNPEKTEETLYEREYPDRKSEPTKGTAEPATAETEAAEPEATETETAISVRPEDRSVTQADRIVHEEAALTPPVAEKDEAAERKLEAVPAEEQVMQTGAVERAARRREAARSQPAAFQEQELACQAKGMVAETTSHVVFLGEDLEPITEPASSPQPSTGNEAFKTYVKENLRFPPEDTLTQMAEVVLQFTVTPEGEIRKIRALRTPGEPFTRQAELLLLEGPPWNPATEQNKKIEDQVRLRFVFRSRKE